MSLLLEGDEQLDRPNSQTTMELCHACVTYFFGFNINTTAFCFGRYSPHILLHDLSFGKFCMILSKAIKLPRLRWTYKITLLETTAS